MKIEFCNLNKQYRLLKNEIDSRIQRVLAHGKFINGPEVDFKSILMKGFFSL